MHAAYRLLLYPLLVLALLALAPASVAGAAEEGRRVALVVGNGAYAETAALPNPPNDARAVAAALRGLGFEVLEATDLDHPAMVETLAGFAERLEGARVGLFFYAGHSLHVAGENYLVPVDARLNREVQVRLQTVPLQTVLQTMEAEVPTRVVLLDACRDNPLARTLARGMGATRSAAVGQGLAAIETGLGTLIAYSTSPGEVAPDGLGSHSPFTAALLEHIGTPGLEVELVLGRVRRSVYQATGGRQRPWSSSSLRDEVYLVPKREAPSPPVAAPSPPVAALPPGEMVLEAVRDFIEPNEIPPKDVGAYGMVAFTHKPTSTTRQRLTFFCEAFLSTLPRRQSLPASVPVSRLMITYWPVERRDARKLVRGDCGYLTDSYDLVSGLQAIRDADRTGRRLAQRRGPFLVGWSPARSRYERDAVVLVMDLSDLESEASFREAFQNWRSKITDNPELWRNGFSVDQIRLALRDFLDRYGEAILKAIAPE